MLYCAVQQFWREIKCRVVEDVEWSTASQCFKTHMKALGRLEPTTMPLTIETLRQVDGGCLALYNIPYSGPLRGAGVAAGEPATVVAPVGGRLVVFESHLFHEVLPAHRSRFVRRRLHEKEQGVGSTTRRCEGLR